MARFGKKTSAEDRKKLKAYGLYITLDANLKQVYTAKEIASKAGITLTSLKYMIYKEGWAKQLHNAIEKAQARASSRRDLHNLLTQYLIEEKELVVVTKAEKAAKAKYIEELKLKHLKKVIENAADIIYEARKYNHHNFKHLMKDTLTPRAREVYHRAWKESLDAVVGLLGIPTLRKMLAEKVDVSFAEEDKTLTKDKIVQEALVNNSNIILDADAHNDIMSIMLGETKIEGPVNYTGFKEKSGTRIEEAIITEPERVNKKS